MSSSRRFLFLASLVLSFLFVLWPIFIMTLEAFDVDLSPLFSGQGITFIGGVPFYSGGFHPNLANLVDAFNIYSFPSLVANSGIISLVNIALAVAAGIPAAYFMARGGIGGGRALGYAVLALRTVSPFAIVIPLYILFVQSGLWDTYPGVALAYLAVDLPVVVLMLRSFFADIPREVFEAAEVSGASERQIFRRVALPLVVAGVAATAIFAFVLIWNEFVLANVLTGGATKTVSVGIWTGAGENIGGFRSVQWDETNMFGLLAFIPAYAVILSIRRYLARGYTLAAAR
ncbi:MAG TPA: carbohydrate ABC transporter permease [Nitrososphaerales archaeon]|nr:carbohydrate ABC transporter permease [Nitrososphaerales archaeon]